MKLVAIDPGCAADGPGCALAGFERGTLTELDFAKTTDDLSMWNPDRIVWECPQCDARSRTIAPTLIKLAAEGALMAGLLAQGVGSRVQSVTPSAWKGSTPKPVQHGRLWMKLSPAEQDVLGGIMTFELIEKAKRKGALDRWSKAGALYYPRNWHTHNWLDAVGIGLWALGRTAR